MQILLRKELLQLLDTIIPTLDLNNLEHDQRKVVEDYDTLRRMSADIAVTKEEIPILMRIIDKTKELWQKQEVKP